MQEYILRQLFLVVLSLSLSGALAGISIAAIHPFTGKYFSKKWNYYIWLLVVVRLLLPFHFESNFLKPLNFHAGFSQYKDLAQNNGGIQFDDIQQSERTGSDHPAAMTGTSVGITTASANGSTDAASKLTSSNTTTALHNEHRTTTHLTEKFSVTGIWTAAAYIWSLGAIFALFITLLNYWRFKNAIKKNCTRITDSRIINMEKAFCANLHIERTPAIYESAAVSSPMTIGLLNPIVVIPEGFSDQYAPGSSCMEQNMTHFQLVLHHELIHIARKDLLYKWICQLLLCVHWFNPVLHCVTRQINRDCELSCDEAILPKLTEAGKQMYGNILLDTAEQMISSRQNAFSTTLLENKKDLKKRLDGILHYKKATRSRLIVSACIFAIMLTVSACSTVWISSANESATVSIQNDSVSTSADTYTPDRSGAQISKSADTNIFTKAWDTFSASHNVYSEPDRSSDAWNAYNDDKLLAGEDIQEYWGAYNYAGGGHKLRATDFFLYGTDSVVIAYAEQEVQVNIRSSFDLAGGNFKIIYIAPDQSIVTLNETGAETARTITMQKGRNVLKMVGQQAQLKNLMIDYSDLKETDFQKIYYSEGEEYAMQVLAAVSLEEPIEKDKAIDALIYLEEKDASELFNALLNAGTTFTAKELYYFLIYSDETLSSRYLSDAIKAGNIEPLSADTISQLMPYLTGDCSTELLKSLPVEEFYDVFAKNIVYLNDDQITECLTDYLDRGGVLTFSMYDKISPFVSQKTVEKLDSVLPVIPPIP